MSASSDPVIDPSSSSPQPHILLNDSSSSTSRDPLRSPMSNTKATVSRSTSLSSPSSSRSKSRQRSLSPAASPMQALDALAGSPPPSQSSPSPSNAGVGGNKIPPPPSNAFASRPSPVVPPSPSVIGSPHHFPSRPTSPRPSRHASEEPSSPTRERSTGGAGGGGAAMLGEGVASTGMGRSSSQVDLSHIFERDVEFAPSHHITPSEAVDVAVPPVLTEAIIALSTTDDPLVSHDVEALIHESEADAQAGSGWSSPIMPPPHTLQHSHSQQSHSSQAHPLSQQHHPPASPSTFSHSAYANASRSPVRSSHSRSFSPDSVDGIEALSSGGEDRRAASPGGSSTAFSGGSPPTSTGEISPPTTSAGGAAFGLGPFGKKLAEALENEANKLPPGLMGTTTNVKTIDTTTSVPAPPSEKSIRANSTSSSSASNLSPLRPANILSPSSSLAVPFPSVSSPSSSSDQAVPLVSASPSSVSPQTELNSNPISSSVTAPHPRRLSFISYADVINEERMAELTGESTGTGTVTPAVGKGPKGGIGAELVEGRLASLLLGE
ncbi:hypothetical protein JCM5350_002384 [Sporobolomyces pararoseus]